MSPTATFVKKFLLDLGDIQKKPFCFRKKVYLQLAKIQQKVLGQVQSVLNIFGTGLC